MELSSPLDTLPPTSAIDSHPRSLAEDLPRSIATESLNHFMTRRTKAGLFHSAWRHVEYALSRDVDLDASLKETYIDDASTLLGKIMRSKTVEDLQLSSLTLSAYLPCFLKRARNETITQEDCDNTYQSLGAAIRYLEPRRPGDPPRWRMTETAVLALAARTRQPELLLYPTSPREEASTITTLNHDSYFLSDSGKIPIQQKLTETAKVYDADIALLNLLPILERGYAKITLPFPESSADVVDELLALIVAETHNQPLQKHEKKLLDHLSCAVAWHYYQHADTRIDQAS